MWLTLCVRSHLHPPPLYPAILSLSFSIFVALLSPLATLLHFFPLHSSLHFYSLSSLLDNLLSSYFIISNLHNSLRFLISCPCLIYNFYFFNSQPFLSDICDYLEISYSFSFHNYQLVSLSEHLFYKLNLSLKFSFLFITYHHRRISLLFCRLLKPPISDIETSPRGCREN